MIKQSDFRRFIEFTQGELTEDPAPGPVGELFREFLTLQLLLQEARSEGITVGTEQMKQYLAEYSPTTAEHDDGLSDHVHEYLLTQKLIKQKIQSQVEVTIRELQVFYEDNADQFTVGDQVRVLEILTKDATKARRIRNELQDGDVSLFREMAKLHSEGVTAESGGDLGLFERGDLPEEFEKVIFDLSLGEISAPFQSRSGYHLFLVEEIIPRHDQKFFEVRTDIFQTLTASKEREAITAYIVDLFDRSDLRILDRRLREDFEESMKNEKSD